MIIHRLDWRWCIVGVSLLLVIGFVTASRLGEQRAISYWQHRGETAWSTGDLPGCVEAYERLVSLSPEKVDVAYRLAVAFDDLIGLPPIATPRQLHQAEQRLRRVLDFPSGSISEQAAQDLGLRLIWRQLQLGGLHSRKAYHRLLDPGCDLPYHRRSELLLVARCLFETLPNAGNFRLEEESEGASGFRELLSVPIFSAIQDKLNLALVDDRSLVAFLRFVDFHQALSGPVDVPDALAESMIVECKRRRNAITTLAAARFAINQSVVDDPKWLSKVTSDALNEALCHLKSSSVSRQVSAEQRMENNCKLELAQLTLPVISESSPESVFKWLKPWEQVFSTTPKDYPVELELQYANCLAKLTKHADLRRFGSDSLKCHPQNVRLHEVMFKLAVESRFDKAYLKEVLSAWGEALSCQGSRLSSASIEGQTGLGNGDKHAEYEKSRWLWHVMSLYYASDEEQGTWDQISQLRQLIATASRDQELVGRRFEVELLIKMGCVGEAASTQELVCELTSSQESHAMAADLWLEVGAYQPALRHLRLLDSPTWMQRLRIARCVWESQYRREFPLADREHTAGLLRSLLASADCTKSEDRFVLRWMLASIPADQDSWGNHIQSENYQGEIREILSELTRTELKPSHAEWIRTPMDAAVFLEQLSLGNRTSKPSVAGDLLRVHCLLIDGKLDAATSTLTRTADQLAASPQWVRFFGEKLLESVSVRADDTRFKLLCQVGRSLNDWEFLYRVARDSSDPEVTERVAELIEKYEPGRVDLTLMLQAHAGFRNEMGKPVQLSGTFGESCERDLQRVLKLRPNWGEVNVALGRVLLARSIRQSKRDLRSQIARQAQECFRQALYLGAQDQTLPFNLGLAASIAGNAVDMDSEVNVSSPLSRVTDEYQARSNVYLSLAADFRVDQESLAKLFKNSEGKARANALHLASRLAWQLAHRQGPNQLKLPVQQVFEWLDEAISITEKHGPSPLLESLLQLKLAWASKFPESELVQKFRQQVEGAPLSPQVKLNWTAALLSGQDRERYLLSQVAEASVLELSVENAINVALADKANVSKADHLSVLKAIVAKWPESEHARLVLGFELVEWHQQEDANGVETADLQGQLRRLLHESEFAKSQHKLLYVDWLIRSRELAKCREARRICRELLATDQAAESRSVQRCLLATLLFELRRGDVKVSQKVLLSKESDALFQQILESSYSLDVLSEYISFLIQSGGPGQVQTAKRLVMESQRHLLSCAASLGWYLEIAEIELGFLPRRDVVRNWFLAVPPQLRVTALSAVEQAIGPEATLDLCLDAIAAWQEEVDASDSTLPDFQVASFSVDVLCEGLDGSSSAECLYVLTRLQKPSESEAEVVSKKLRRFYQQHSLGRDEWQLYADYLNERGEKMAAQRIYLTLVERYPNNLTFTNNFASLAAETGAQMSLADSKLRIAISRHPGHPVLLGTLDYLSAARETFSGDQEVGK